MDGNFWDGWLIHFHMFQYAVDYLLIDYLLIHKGCVWQLIVAGGLLTELPDFFLPCF